jgi:hypothetical protein
MFSVGDLVVCIDNKPKKGAIGAIVPIHELIREGRVYRIDFIGRSRFGKLTLGLLGIELPPPMMGFAPYRFRKVKPADPDFVAAVRSLDPKTTRAPQRTLDPVG